MSPGASLMRGSCTAWYREGALEAAEISRWRGHRPAFSAAPRKNGARGSDIDLELTGKVAVITGGSSGIGLAAAQQFLAEGAKVAICGRNQGRLDAAVAALGADGTIGFACDVLDAEAVERFRERVAGRFGRADILVNNAGQARMKRFAETSDRDWRDELDLKFFSVLNPTRAFLPLLEAAAPSAIVCTNALLARRPEPHLIATAAARAGVLNLAKSLSREFAPKGIRVNSVLVGLVDSGQWRRRYETGAGGGLSMEEWFAKLAAERDIPLARLGISEEVAKTIVFLASPAASFLTGQALEVAGGQGRHV